MKTHLRNITVTLEAELAKWARIEAARHEMSMSRFLAQLLKKEREEEDRYAWRLQDRFGFSFWDG